MRGMEQEQELKERFAEEWLKKPDDPMAAAMIVFGGDIGLALQAINGQKSWTQDAFVAKEKIRLLEEHGAKAFLPSKEQQAADIYKIAQDNKVDDETRLKAHRLYAEIMSYIEKPATTGGINILNQGVMVVKDHGSDDEWESRARNQQHNLIHAPN